MRVGYCPFKYFFRPPVETGSWISKTTTFMAVARFLLRGWEEAGHINASAECATAVGGFGVSSPITVVDVVGMKLYFSYLS